MKAMIFEEFEGPLKIAAVPDQRPADDGVVIINPAIKTVILR